MKKIILLFFLISVSFKNTDFTIINSIPINANNIKVDNLGNIYIIKADILEKYDSQGKLFKSYNTNYEDGHQKRDFLYVKDAVEVTVHLANTSNAHGLYNIGSGVAHTWIDLVTPIFEALEKPLNIDFIEMPDALREKYQYYTCADIGKLRSTGYHQEPTLLDLAVKDYVLNYLAPNKSLGQPSYSQSLQS